MKINFKTMPIFAAIMAMIGSACHTTAQAQSVPAIINSADKDTLQILTTTLAKAMKTSKVELGASDPTKSPTVSVLPKSVVGIRGGNYANFALPTQFDLIMEGTNCYAVKRGTDIKIMLEGVSCQPFKES